MKTKIGLATALFLCIVLIVGLRASAANVSAYGDRSKVETQRLVLTDKGWQVWNESDQGVSLNN